MSRARLVCSEILSRMSPIHQFDDKVYSICTSQDKVFNLCFNEYSNGENSDVSSVLSEMNSSLDDWLRQKSTCTSMEYIDNNYLSDINFLSIREPDDVGLELILVNNDNENINDKKETNFNYCSTNEKNADTDFTDPLLNLVSMNEVLLRKTETKCDNFLNEETKNKSDWDTLSIASRKSDCDVINSRDFSEFSLLPLSFEIDTTENNHIHTESLPKKHDSDINQHSNHNCDSNLLTNVFGSDSLCVNKTNMQQPITIALVSSTASLTPSIVTSTSGTLSVSSSTSSSLFYSQNKTNVSMNIKRPNILRTTAVKSKIVPTIQNEVKVINSKTTQSFIMELSNTDTINESVFDFTNPDEELRTLLPDELSICKKSEEKKSMQKYHNIEIGSVIVVSNFKSRTHVIINHPHGVEHYEGNTAELTESLGRSRRSASPAEGKHTVTAVNTAVNTSDREQDDQVLHDMLTVLGITYNMLYNIITDRGLCIWMCPLYECRRIFNRLNTLKSHILSHYGLKPFKCDFPNCPWSFYTSFKLKRHRETHLKRKDFTCTVADCNRSFTTVYNLNTHLKLHDRPARLKCLVRSCNALFQTRRAMETHLKTHELALAPYKCSAAGCSKLYFSLGALTAHTRVHQHKEELRCQWENCGRRFDKPCRLRAHMRMHTGDKPYVCRYQDCHWAFASSSKLKRHQYKHNNERRFRCTIGDCTKAFMRSEHLREHTFTHIAQRTFQCSICGEKCSAKATLYVHKKKYHSNINKQSAKSSNFNSNQKLKSNSTVFFTLVSSDNETSNKIEQNTNKSDHFIKGHQISNQSVTASANCNINKGHRKLKTKVNKSCARTYLPYVERMKDISTINDNSSIVIQHDKEILSLSSLNTTMNTDTDEITNQQTIYLSNFTFQENSDTITSNGDIYTPDDGAEYILLFDSTTNTTFPESTINLKDLD